MPTSSQALILIKTDSGRLSNFYRTRITPEITPFPVSKVNLTGVATPPRVSLRARSGVIASNSQKETFMPSKPLEGLTVNGYRGVLSFDPVLRSFRWQLLPDPTDNTRKPRDPRRPVSAPDFDTGDGDDTDHIREKIVLTHLDDSPSPLDPPITNNPAVDNNYHRLLDLGFKTSSFKGMPTPPSPEPWDSRLVSGEDDRIAARPLSGRHVPKKGFLRGRQLSAPNMESSKSQSKKPETRSEKTLSPQLSPSQEKKLLDDVKKTKRKKSKLPTMRMRRELPSPSPHALCFRLKNKRCYAHGEIKRIIEEQIQTTIGSLMYDPVYLHLGVDNTDGECLWVFTLPDDALRMLLIHQGLIFEGDRVRVRRYDDVLFDEHEAYRLFQKVIDEQRKRQLCSPKSKASLQKTLGSSGRLEKHVSFSETPH